MKKLSFYIMALVAIVFTSCGDDYSTSTPPQSNLPESALKSDAIQFAPVNIGGINLQQLIAEDKPVELGTVTVAEGQMPKNTIVKARIDISRDADYSEYATVDCESMAETDKVTVLPSELQAAYYNEFTHNPNLTDLYIRIHLYTVTDGTSEAIVGTPGENYYGNYKVLFTPVNEGDRHIANAYYAMVLGLDGKWIETKFDHEATDVYDDPVFTLSIDALKDAANVRHDTKFYVVADEDLEKFKAGDVKLGFGKGEGESLLRGGAPIVGPATDGASRYELTINMEKQTIVIEPIVIFHCYYVLTNGAAMSNMKIVAPEEYRCYMFYKTSETTFTYTTFWANNTNGSSQFNVKVWEREAMLANATSNSWGFNGGSKDERLVSGDFKKAGGWLGPVTEGWYTFTITMDEENKIHKYTWTAVQETEKYNQISIVGANGEKDLTQCKVAPHNWYLLDYEVTAETKVKFRANHADTKVWGGDGSQPINPTVYTLPAGSQEITVPAGTYDIFLNDITGNWTILKTNK